MAPICGKEDTNKKIMPILTDLLRLDKHEVSLMVVEGLGKIARVVGLEDLKGII